MNGIGNFNNRSSYCGNRLDLEALIPIVTQFRANINVIDWGKWGHTTKAFMPFERLACMQRPGDELDVDLVEKWMKENYPFSVPEKPEGTDGCDVMWMPECTILYYDDEYHAVMDYNVNLCTEWSLALVATCVKDKKIMVHNKFVNEWAELVIEPFEYNKGFGTPIYTHMAFVNLLHAWLPW